MINLIKKIKAEIRRRKAPTELITIKWKWIDNDTIYITEGTSAGIASALADPCIEVLG